MNVKEEEDCPCKSGKKYGECCRPVIAGEAKAETAEALMRARYTSYVVGAVDFLKTSAVKAIQEQFDEEASRAWSDAARWHGLEVICNHHEVATFVKDRSGWKFEDGDLVGETPTVREEPKVGRNDPCPCGSGKKYKKCCGREG